MFLGLCPLDYYVCFLLPHMICLSPTIHFSHCAFVLKDIYLFLFYGLKLWNSRVFILFDSFISSYPTSLLVSWPFYRVLEFSTYLLCWFLFIRFFFKLVLLSFSNSLAFQQIPTFPFQQSHIASFFQYNFISENVREVQSFYLQQWSLCWCTTFWICASMLSFKLSWHSFWSNCWRTLISYNSLFYILCI